MMTVTSSTTARTFRRSLLTAGALSAVLGFGHANAERVGVASAVNPQATGTPLQGEMRLIHVGLDVLRNERINTGPAGRTQLLFLDGSALTVGPNSDMVLDEFVYDPELKTGKIALSAAKGLFRFVGGRISKQGGVSIKTPTALIGIRGGIGIIEVTATESRAERSGDGLASGAEATLDLAQSQPAPSYIVTTATLAFGEMTIASGGAVTLINRPGFQVTVSNPDAPPGQPVQAPPQGADQAQQGLEGSGDNTGGPERPPTNEDVAGSQLSELSSGRQPTQIAPVPPGPGPAPARPSTAGIKSADASREAQRNMVLDLIAGTSGGERDTGLSSSRSFGGHYLRQTPFTGFDFNTGQTAAVPANNYSYANGTLSNGYFTAALSNGSIKLPAMTGSFTFASTGTSSPFGAVSGNGFGASDSSFFYWRLNEVAQSSNPASLFAGVPYTGQLPTAGISVYDLSVGFPGNSVIPMLPASYGGGLTGSLSPRLYVAWSTNVTSFSGNARSTALFAAIAIDGSGASQKSAMLTYTGTFLAGSTTGNKTVLAGYSRGSVRLAANGTPIRVDGGGGGSSLDGEGNAIFGLNGPDYLVLGPDHYLTGSVERVNAAGFVQTLESPAAEAATFYTETIAQRGSASATQTRSSRTLNGYVSGLATAKVGSSTPAIYVLQTLNNTPTNFSITTDASTNRLKAQANTQDAFSSQDSLQIPFGGITGSGGGRSAFINDGIFGARESATSAPVVGSLTGTGRIGLVTSSFVNSGSAALNGVSLCNCGYVQWGFISGELRNSTNRQRLHLLPWVAGELSNPTIIAGMVGSATYNGHAVANVMNGSDQYVAFGQYQQNWNFGSRTGNVTITNLDGATYSGSLTEVNSSSGRDFTGSIGGSSRSGTLVGSFVKGGPVEAGELAAQFHVTGSSYYAAGIAAARQP